MSRALESPFFMNLYFYKPSAENVSKNKSHISYIGMRPGVDLGTEKKLDEAALHNRFELNVEENVYKTPNSAAGHVKYAHERPRSHGLFSSEEVKDVKVIQQELDSHKGIVWRGILSLNETDAITLGYDEREAWEDTLRSTVPLMANEMGIPESNLRWVAAFHQEKGHPHIHLVVWEKDPKRQRGLLTYPETKEIKKIFVNEIYGEERLRLSQEKTAVRDLIRHIAREDLVKTVELVREVRAEQKQVELEMRAAGAVRSVGIPPKLYKETNVELADKLSQLAAFMPQRGRLSYQFMPNDVRAKVDDISDWILKQPAQKESLDKYLQTVEWMTRQYTFKSEQIETAKNKAYADIRKRISQIALKAASESQKDQFVNVVPEKAHIVIEQFSQATGAPDDVSHAVIQRTIQHLRLLGLTEQEQKELFDSWKKQAELRMNPVEVNHVLIQEYKRPVIEGELNLSAMSAALKLSGKNDKEITELFQSRLGLATEEANAFLQNAEHDLTESKELFLSKKDWNRFNQNMGTNEAYPWRPKEISTIIPQARRSLIENLDKAVFSPAMSDQERGWTTYCITVGLKQLGVSADDRRVIMGEFASRNRVPDLGRILARVEEVNTNYLKKPTWDKVTNDIGIKTEYPWIIKEFMVLDRDTFAEVVPRFEKSRPKQTDKQEAQWTAEQYVQILKAIQIDKTRVNEIAKRWDSRAQSLDLKNTRLDANGGESRLLPWIAARLDEKELPLSSTPKQRTNDIEVMRKHFGIKDLQYETVSNFARVMFAAGLHSEYITKMVRDWNIRSNANISEQKIDKALASAEKYCHELISWGRVPFVRKKDFQGLCKTLRVNAPWMWRGDREVRKYERNAAMGMAQGVWKSVWRGIEQERVQTEAKGEILKQQLIREQVYRRQQSEEQER